MNGIQEVSGSIPLISTTVNFGHAFAWPLVFLTPSVKQKTALRASLSPPVFSPLAIQRLFLSSKQTNYSGSIPLISTTRKPALELRSGAFSFSGCKYRTPSATSHCRGCLHKFSVCKAKPITVLLAHAKQQPYQCAPRAGPHRCDQSDHKLQFAYRWGAANPARG